MRWRILPGAALKSQKGFSFFMLFLGFALLGPAAPASAASPAGLAERGQAVFQQKCVSCHTIGGGRTAGPDLQGVTARRERDWLVRFNLAPEQVLAQGDPIATRMLKEFNNLPMPNLGLKEEEVAAVLAYLESASGVPAPKSPQDKPAQAPGTAATSPGDPGLGMGLFTGTIPLERGGLPCLACHGLAGLSALGGGSLGPDLSATYAKFGEAGLGPVLAALPFPSMQPIYEQRPLTAAEQAHLKAFFQETAATPTGTPAPTTWQLALLAGASLLVLFALAQVIWRGRLKAGRGSLVARAQVKGGIGQ